jgi:uncharacterized protein
MAYNDIPRAFHIMAKPGGAKCNLNCAYCFFLKKERLYPGAVFHMSDEIHEAYIRQVLEAHQTPRVTVAWQGGEPTLMGLDFFRRSIELQEKYRKPGTHIENTFQTNGVLLNDEWCRFFQENGFLIGLSVDGPRELHDFYRKDKGGEGTFNRVMKAARLLQEYKVEFNILCAVNRKNADHPLEVYRFFKDELGAQYLQFIPIVEKDDDCDFNPTLDTTSLGCVSPPLRVRGGRGSYAIRVTDRSVLPDQWGRFLIKIFDEWVKRDVGRTFVLNFDGALAGWLGMSGTLCIFGPTCGLGMALEHNGDLYSCDHFVEPDYYLGNILETPMIDLVTSDKQRRFGQDKRDTLPQCCRNCEFLSICNGECPKNRFIETPDGEPGLNYLCAGYKAFFSCAQKPMRIMAELIRRGRPTAEIMPILAGQAGDLHAKRAKIGRNDPCSCGSGLKFKKCHGRS